MTEELTAEMAIRQSLSEGPDRDERGRILPGHRPKGLGFTPESSRLAVKRRVENAKARARAALENKAKEMVESGVIDTRHTKGEFWEILNEHAFEVYMKSDSARGLSELGAFIGRNTGQMNDPADAKQPEETERHSPALEDAAMIIAAFEYYKGHKEELKPPANVIDVTVT